MSVCTFIVADCDLPEVIAPDNYPVHIDVNKGTVYDGDADDNIRLLAFRDADLYSSKKYGVLLEWNYYTEGRANKLISYIKEILQYTDTVELQHVWIDGGCWEYEERPVMHKKTINIADLTTVDIKELSNAEIWNKPDKTYPNRPAFYCLVISK